MVITTFWYCWYFHLLVLLVFSPVGVVGIFTCLCGQEVAWLHWFETRVLFHLFLAHDNPVWYKLAHADADDVTDDADAETDDDDAHTDDADAADAADDVKDVDLGILLRLG